MTLNDLFRRRPAPLGVGLPLLLAGLFAGCPPEEIPPGVDSGPDQACPIDLLYNEENSQDIDLDQDLEGYLCPAFDEDWYRFEVPGSGASKILTVTMSMQTALSNAEPAYRIMNEDGTPTGLSGQHPNRSAGEAVDFSISHAIEPGTYFLVVLDAEGLDDRFDNDNPYSFSLAVDDDPDGNEPNDNADEATPATAGMQASGLISTTGDEDWYAVTIDNDAQILDVVAAAPLDVEVDLMLEAIEGATGTVLQRIKLLPDDTASPTELTARLRVGVAGSPGAQFYLRVYDELGEKANFDPATGTYTLDIAVEADPDPQEAGGRNDTTDTATVANTNGTPVSFTASLSAANDQDIYSVPVSGVAVGDPKVLIVNLTVSGGVPDQIQPQVRVLAHDPELDDGSLEACPCEAEASPDNPIPLEPPQFCLATGSAGDRCGELRFQRVVNDRTTFSFGYPLRNNRTVYVSVNDFGDDEWQETNDYSIELNVVNDPDPGETGDDYLIPNLQTASYDNSEDLGRQAYESRPRARDISVPMRGSCPLPGAAPSSCDHDGLVGTGGTGGTTLDGGPGPDGGFIVVDGGAAQPADCDPVIAVPAPIDGSPQCPYYVECSGQSYTVTGTGRLAYQGDRDWFTFDMPAAGYWSMDATYTTSTSTPVELTFFVHGGDSLIGAWLEANKVQDGCDSSADCPAGTTCIDNKCWEDIDNNPAATNSVFPAEADQCLFLHVNDSRPVFVEIADNGVNDFDPNMEYSFSILIECGCPESCGGGTFDSCQGVTGP